MASEIDTPSVVNKERKEDKTSPDVTADNPKTMSSDFGKKIQGLEHAIEELKRSTASASDIKDIKDSFSNLSDIKNKLREMEDLDLITRMETIKAEDDIHILTESVESLKSKLDLLAGAIKIMGTKLGKDDRSISPEMRREYQDAGKDVVALKSELDTIRKNLETTRSTDYSGQISALEQKYKEIDARIKTASSGKAEKTSAAAGSKEDIDALKKDLSALKEAVVRERTSLEPEISTLKSLKEKSADIEKSIAEMKKKQQDTESTEESREKDMIALKSDLDAIRKNLDSKKIPDYSDKFTSIEQKYKEIDERLKAASEKTDKTSAAAGSKEDIDALKKDISALKDAVVRERTSLLEPQISILKSLKEKSYDIEKSIAEMKKKQQDAESTEESREKDMIALKSDLDTIRKNLDSKKIPDYSDKFTSIEQKYKEIDARIKAASEKTDKTAAVAGSKEDIDALKKDLTALKGIVLREITSLEPEIRTLKSLKEKSYDIEKSIAEMKKKQQDAESTEESREKDITALKSDMDAIRKNLDSKKIPDYSYKIISIEQKYKEIDERLKAASEKTDKTSAAAGSKEDIDALKKDLSALKDAVVRERTSLLEPQISILNSLKEKSADIEKSIAEMKKKQQDAESAKESHGKIQAADTQGIDQKTLANIKYIPLLKDNLSKLYNVYNITEKKISDIEKSINNIGTQKMILADDTELAERIEKAVESELAEVLENIDSLTKEIKTRIDGESAKQKAISDSLKQEHSSQTSAIAGFDARVKKLEQARPYNNEDFADFKARVLADIEDLKKSARNISTKMSEHVENMVDNKIMPHVSTQNKIAETVSILNRKVEEKHLEISKNTHEKVDRTTKQIMEKITQLENDVTLLKDMRVDIVEDMSLILERFEKDTGKPRAISDEIEGRYDKKLDVLSKEIDTLKTREMTGDESDIREIHALRELVHAVRNENDILKVELDKIKRFYMDMLKREEDAPVIIE